MHFKGEKRPELVGIKNEKIKYRIVHLHSDYESGDIVVFKDGTKYDVREDGSWRKRENDE